MNPNSEANPHIKIPIKGDNHGTVIGYVKGDFNNNVTKQNLARSATEIQELLAQLSQASDAEKQLAVVKKVEEQIQVNPTLKKRLKNALIEGGIQALREVLELIYNNPIISVSVETIKGFLEADPD